MMQKTGSRRHYLVSNTRAVKRPATIFMFGLAVTVLVGCATPTAGESMFVTRSSATKSPAQLHEAIRNYASERKWLYIGENKLKAGEVTQVRLCIAEAARDIWKVGMHMAALMPCGHFGIYQEGGATRVTLLHPQYMTRVDSHPIVRKLADDVSGPFVAMLDQVTR